VSLGETPVSPLGLGSECDRPLRPVGYIEGWYVAENHRVHEALGYQVVDRCVHYRKTL